MAGIHRKRIEALEAKFNSVEAGMGKIDIMFERIMQRNSKKRDLSSSAEECSEFGSSSSDVRYARIDEGDKRPHIDDDRGKG